LDSAATTSDLTDHLGYWLRLVSNHVSQAFARKVEARGVTVAEWVVMRQLLDVEVLAPSRLAERMGATRGTVSKLADRLIGKGLAIRSPDPEDGRGQTLSLTLAGRTLTPELALLADQNDAEVFGGLSARDRAALARILRSIVDNRGLKAMPIE